MKAQEKDSDRRANVHVHVQEQVEELAEYGQYVDPVDGALCCYIAVSNGDIIKMTGRFSGTVSALPVDVFQPHHPNTVRPSTWPTILSWMVFCASPATLLVRL